MKAEKQFQQQQEQDLRIAISRIITCNCGKRKFATPNQRVSVKDEKAALDKLATRIEIEVDPAGS